ncbi:type I DNA topoisomerase [Alteromonas antoniana]|uniref:type I DNA topoisomerase n=1 Tax=Alteromonas antoniana TaxID=2803813 RepID=UPI001C48E7F0
MTVLVIVESPGKTKTIAKILGSGHVVQASVGHIRDLPAKSMGVDTSTWAPTYEATNQKSINNLKYHAKSASNVVLATDNDREGEAIAWHIAKVLGLNPEQCDRISFTEITSKAINEAMRNKGRINMRMVAAQEARRVVDRVLGYTISPALSDHLSMYTSLSAGRVQSVALKIVALREIAIREFVITDHYVLACGLQKDGVKFDAVWDFKKHFKGTPIPADINGGRDDYWTNKQELDALASQIKQSPKVKVVDVEEKPSKSKPPPPFITSTFQMACSSKYKIPPAKAMQYAQSLYEKGFITYMRTDTPNLSDDAISDVRAYLSRWCLAKGVDEKDYIPSSPNKWKSKEDAQEAHEAIRPTNLRNMGEEISDALEKKIYLLIFQRTVASQMANAVFDTTRAELQTAATCDGRPMVLTARGKVLKKPGWKAFLAKDDADTEEDNSKEQTEARLPALDLGTVLSCDTVRTDEKKTAPPSRFTSASLVKALESEGIGRPSTYASIMSTIIQRQYVEVIDKKTDKLQVTEKGLAVFNVLDPAFTFMDISYTKTTELQLDDIQAGKLRYRDFLQRFYSGFSKEANRFHEVGDQRSSAPVCPTCETRKLRKVKNKKRPGHTWLCKGYFDKECNGAFPDANGQPDLNYKPPTSTNHACPKCNKGLTRYYNDGSFAFSCKACKVKIPGDESTPDYDAFRKHERELESALSCPECSSGKIVKRSSKRGYFYSCNQFPDCSVTMKPDSKGAADIEGYKSAKAELEKAPTCKKCKKGKMIERKSSRGNFLGCNRYPKCKNRDDVKEPA